MDRGAVIVVQLRRDGVPVGPQLEFARKGSKRLAIGVQSLLAFGAQHTEALATMATALADRGGLAD